MLDRAHSPDAEQFLLAAATLKPTAHVEEGQARAWLALAHLSEDKNPNCGGRGLSQSLGTYPKDPEPHLSAGLLHERQKEFSDAEAEYKQVLMLDPHSTDAAVGLTNIYMKSNRLSDAEPLLRRLADRSSQRLRSFPATGARTRGREASKMTLSRSCKTALKLAPTDADAQREIADFYASAGKNDLAETAYRVLLTAHSNDPELHRSLGKALLHEKKFPEAQQEFLTALRLKRDWPDIYVDLAFAASENKNYELTVRALNGRAHGEYRTCPPSAFFFAPLPTTTFATTNWRQSIIIIFSMLPVASILIRSGRLRTG